MWFEDECIKAHTLISLQKKEKSHKYSDKSFNEINENSLL